MPSLHKRNANADESVGMWLQAISMDSLPTRKKRPRAHGGTPSAPPPAVRPRIASGAARDGGKGRRLAPASETAGDGGEERRWAGEDITLGRELRRQNGAVFCEHCGKQHYTDTMGNLRLCPMCIELGRVENLLENSSPSDDAARLILYHLGVIQRVLDMDVSGDVEASEEGT